MPADGTPPPASGLALIRRSIRRHQRRLAMGYPLLVLWQLCETLVPVVIGFVVDHAIATGRVSDLLEAGLVLVALFLTLAYGYRFGSRFVLRSIEIESHLLRLEVSAHALHPRGARTDLLPGELQSLATSDADLVPTVMRHLGFAIASLSSIIVVAVYLLQVDLLTGLLVLLGVPTVLVLIQAASPAVARRTAVQQRTTAAATGLAADLINGLRPLKGIGGEDVAQARYRRASRDAADATIALARSWGHLSGLTTGLSLLLLAVVAWVASTAALDGRITLGELIAIVGLTQFLAEPLRALGDFSAQFAGARAAASRLVGFLSTPHLVATGEADPGITTTLTLRDAAFGSLTSFDLQTHDQELLAVVIDDPATVDRLLAVLTGERAPDSGTVLLGDAPLADLSMDARRAVLTVAPHHPSIPAGTLRSIVDPGGAMSADRLTEVLRAAAADEVVQLHPDGLERHVRSDGTTLSGGQRQRLSLARALGRDSPILVLHDPTSAIDAVTEQSVAAGLAALRRRPGRTTIVITSSPPLLQVADRVVVVASGRIIMTGQHDDLLQHATYQRAVLR